MASICLKRPSFTPPSIYLLLSFLFTLSLPLHRYAQRWSDLHHFFYLPSATAERSWGAEYERRALEYRDMLVRYKTDAERFKHADAIKTMERLLQVMHFCMLSASQRLCMSDHCIFTEMYFACPRHD